SVRVARDDQRLARVLGAGLIDERGHEIARQIEPALVVTDRGVARHAPRVEQGSHLARRGLRGRALRRIRSATEDRRDPQPPPGSRPSPVCVRGTSEPQAQSSTRRRRSAFAMTETEETLMAALATIGLSSRPITG